MKRSPSRPSAQGERKTQRDRSHGDGFLRPRAVASSGGPACHDIRAALQRIVRAPPFDGRVGIGRIRTIGSGRPRAMVCVPAHRERDHVAAMIEAWARAAASMTPSCGLIVLVNNSTDGTFEAASRAASAAAGRFAGDPMIALIEVSFAAACADVGHARRLALDLGGAIGGVEWLLSSDADTLVARDWIERAHAALADCDLVCGHTDVDPSELAALPPSVAACGRAEAELGASLEALWRAVGGPSGRGFANRGAGANMAMRAAAYRQLGGLPPLRSGEDRALHALFERRGRIIRHDATMRVRTSCRLDERAQGGMAGCLVRRASDRDPPVDSELMPARTLLRRALLHRLLFTRTGDAADLAAHTRRLADRIGAPVGALRLARTAPHEGWERLGKTLPLLYRRELRASQARREAGMAAWMRERIAGGTDPLDLLEAAGPRPMAGGRAAGPIASAARAALPGAPSSGLAANGAGTGLHG